MNKKLEEYYTSKSDVFLKQKRIELMEFMRKVFDDNSKASEFAVINARYEYVEDLLRMRGAL